MINPLVYVKIIIAMIWKNFKNIIRSRSSALVILLGPFLIIFLIGTAFNTTGLHNIKVGIYAEETSPVLDEVLSSLTANDFSVLTANTELQCTEFVVNGQAHICISFPAGLTDQNLEREIIFHVDYSKVNLVFTILNVITHEVEDISTDLSVEYTRLLIEQMNRTSGEIAGKAELVGTLSANARDMRTSLALMSSELSGIPVDRDEFGLSEVEGVIAESSTQIDQFGDLASDATDAGMDLLDDLEDTVDVFEADLNSQIALVEDFDDSLANYEALACVFDWSGVSGLTFDPCNEVRGIEALLGGAIAQADAMGQQFSVIKSQLDDVRSELENVEDEQDALLAAASDNIGALESQLQNSSAKVDEIGGQRDDLVMELDLLVATLDDNIASIGEIENSISQISDDLANAEIADPERVVNPILTRIKPLLEKKSYLDYTMPALLVLIIMFMSILLSTTIVMTEKQTRAYFRNYITPVPDITFLISIYLTNIMIVGVQAAILMIIAELVFGVAILSNIVSIVVAILLISTIFIQMGMSIGYLFVSEETGTLAAISLSSVFLLFSSFLIPLESLSKTIGAIAVFNPFVVSESVLRQLIIFGNDIFAAWNDVMMLLIYVVALAILLYVCEMIDKRRLR